MIAGELQGRRGRQADGGAKTREVKIGCVFTQTTTDQDGLPVRDPESTTFVAALETAEAFGWRLYAEALRRGLLRAERVVVLGDGAEWIRNLVEMHFHGAVQILDVYHAREHLAELCQLLWPQDSERAQHERKRWWNLLDEDGVETIIQEARLHSIALSEGQDRIRQEIGYLQKNAERMRYARFRASGLFVGSGVVEAGCRSLVGQRLKQSGMKWSVRGANAILALRCILRSRRWEDYRESRLSA